MQSYELFGALVTVVVEFGKIFFQRMARHVWGERSGWQAQKCQGLPCGMFATPLGVFYAISYHRQVAQVIIGKWHQLSSGSGASYGGQ